jgi:hypothetical protein
MNLWYIHKMSSSYHNKIIIWISFSNLIIQMLTKKKNYSFLYKQYSTRLDTNWTLELAKKNQSHIITKINKFQFN